jgi:hypothetical protein
MKTIQATRYNKFTERLAKQKTDAIKISIEHNSMAVFTNFTFLITIENQIDFCREKFESWDEFKTTLIFSPLMLIVIYFLDAFFTKDVLDGFLLPQAYSDKLRQILCWIVPALFLVADMVLGLSRVQIRTLVAHGLEKSIYLLFINLFAIGFCAVIPALILSTVIQYYTLGEVSPGIVIGRLVMCLLSIVLHGYIIWSFPKSSFDQIVSSWKIWGLERKAKKYEKKMFDALNTINQKFLLYRSKSEKFQSINSFDTLGLTMKTKFLINKISMEEIFKLDDTKSLVLFEDHPIWERIYPKPQLISLENTLNDTNIDETQNSNNIYNEANQYDYYP